MEHPEKYPQLTVRVSGYAVNFVRLTREQQLDVINRTFHASYLHGPRTDDAEDGMVEAGSRYDLRTGKSPDAPETASFEGTEATCGWVHSYETGSTVDGPGVRLMLFMSGCFLRCHYCHNPDTWHIKDGTRIELAQAIRRLGDFAPALRSLGGGLTISGGEPLVQIGFTRGLFAAAKQLGLHTALDTSGFLGHRADDAYLENVDLVLLDIKSGDPDTYRRVTGRELHPTCASPSA